MLLSRLWNVGPNRRFVLKLIQCQFAMVALVGHDFRGFAPRFGLTQIRSRYIDGIFNRTGVALVSVINLCCDDDLRFGGPSVRHAIIGTRSSPSPGRSPRELIRLGVPRRQAIRQAEGRQDRWPMVKTIASGVGMTNARLREQGMRST